jgi:CelD/BcsL family acetyltransferase involved in cellulose biosynthesis
MAPPVTERTFELELHDQMESLQGEWQALAEESGNLFATWEWVSTWWSHFGRGHDLVVGAVRGERSRLVGVLPLHVHRLAAIRMLRFVGHGAGDQLGPVCAPRDLGRISDALRQILQTTGSRWDLFLGEQLPADEHWNAALGAKIVAQTGLPLVRAPGLDWEGFLASKSSNFRQQARRRERNLVRRYRVQYRFGSAETLAADLDILFALHRLRWGRRPSLFAAQEQFHREFAARALDRGWLRLWFLELDGEPVAAWYGFRFSNVEYFYQAGRDPAREGSPGFVLLCHSMRAALDDGVDEYRLLRGAEEYKYRFATLDRGLDTVAVARSVVGRTAVAAGRLARRFTPLKEALKGPLRL